MKAEIKWIIDDDNKEGLWLLIGGNYETAWAIEEGEIPAIKSACEKWLKTKAQKGRRKMKQTSEMKPQNSLEEEILEEIEQYLKKHSGNVIRILMKRDYWIGSAIGLSDQLKGADKEIKKDRDKYVKLLSSAIKRTREEEKEKTEAYRAVAVSLQKEVARTRQETIDKLIKHFESCEDFTMTIPEIVADIKAQSIKNIEGL